jgi:FMN phosphatase YigB (HAD superfamily)
MERQKAFLFDMDGTIANNDHRRGFVTSKPSNWKAYNAGIPFDSPIEPVIAMVRLIYNAGIPVIITSARNESDRKVTEAWLMKYDVPFTRLYLRGDGDSRRDSIVKLEILEKLREDGYEPMAVFDDRPQVVRECWRHAGIFVFDVYQGDEEF